MSTEQTNSRKSKIQIPDGWSPIDGKEKTKFQEMPEKGATTEISPDSNVTGENKDSIGVDVTIQPEENTYGMDSLQTESADVVRSTVSKRTSGKQRKESLEEYRQTFLSVPKLEDRKPVFISREVRDKLDEITRKLGGRGRSVSGFIENLAWHHLELYWDDVELWKKL